MSDTTSRGVAVSDKTVHATTAPTNGAVANTSWPRAAPRSRAPATHNVIDTPYPNAPTTSAASTFQPSVDAPTPSPIARFAPPATTPFTTVMCAGASSSSSAVTQLSTPQHKHAPPISSTPHCTSALADHPRTTPATTTSTVPVAHTSPYMLPKHERGENSREHQLEIEQQR